MLSTCRNTPRPLLRARVAGLCSTLAPLTGPAVARLRLVSCAHPRRWGDVPILDNLVDEVLPAAQRGDLAPVFSFNSPGL